MITNRVFCDFVMWTKKGLVIQRIHHDVRFWEKLEKKLTAFYVLPEILTHRLKEMNSESNEQDVYCVC